MACKFTMVLKLMSWLAQASTRLNSAVELLWNFVCPEFQAPVLQIQMP
jgi:hypothetical protein